MTRSDFGKCSTLAAAVLTILVAGPFDVRAGALAAKGLRGRSVNVVIIDEATGRRMPDRHWREGLHQADGTRGEVAGRAALYDQGTEDLLLTDERHHQDGVEPGLEGQILQRKVPGF